MQLVMNPYQYDILLLEKSYGRYRLRPVRGLVGGLGLVPGANFGHECAIFEAVHGSAPDIAGKNIANPTAVLRSALLMLRHIGEAEAAWKIRNAIDQVYRDQSKLTRDVGGQGWHGPSSPMPSSRRWKRRSIRLHARANGLNAWVADGARRSSGRNDYPRSAHVSAKMRRLE